MFSIFLRQAETPALPDLCLQEQVKSGGTGLCACHHAAKQGVSQGHLPSAHGRRPREEWGLRLVPKKNP